MDVLNKIINNKSFIAQLNTVVACMRSCFAESYQLVCFDLVSRTIKVVKLFSPALLVLWLGDMRSMSGYKEMSLLETVISSVIIYTIEPPLWIEFLLQTCWLSATVEAPMLISFKVSFRLMDVFVVE